MARARTLLSARIIFSVLIAAFFVLVFVNATYYDFERIRIPLIDTGKTATDNSLKIRFARPPGKDINILQLKLANQQPASRKLSVLINADHAGSSVLPAHSSRTTLFLENRLIQSRKDNTLEIQSDGPGWTLNSAEIQNVYGSMKSLLLSYVIVSRDLLNYEGPSRSAGLILFVFFLFLGVYGEKRISLFQSRLSVLPLALVVLFFLIILLSPLVSKYRLLLSLRSFSLFALLCYSSALRNAYRKTKEKADSLSANGGVAVQSGLVILGIFCFYYFLVADGLREHQGNFSGFATLSEKFVSRNPMLQERPDLLKQLKLAPGSGYDAQFFYAMTFDPFLERFADKPGKYTRFIDSPVFRYRRIGFPLLIKLFSGDQPEQYPKTMVLLILLSFVPFAFFLVKIALFFEKQPSWALLCILIPGLTMSLRIGLPEAIAASFFLAGFYCALKERFLLCLVCFSASLMVRETAMPAILLLAAFEFFKKKKLKNAIIVSASVLPLAAWRIFVTWKFLPLFGWRGFFFEPPNLTFPFYGVAQLFWNIGKRQWPDTSPLSAILFTLLLALILVTSASFLRRRFEYPGAVTFLYAFLAFSLSYQAIWLALINPERQTFECFLFFLLLFLSLPKEMRAARISSLCVFFAFLVYDCIFFSLAYDFRSGFLTNDFSMSFWMFYLPLLPL